MTQTEPAPEQPPGIPPVGPGHAARFRRWPVWALAGLGVAAMALALVQPDSPLRLSLMTFGAVLAAAALLIAGQAGWRRLRRRLAGDLVDHIVAHDAAANLISDAAGRILTCNAAARSRFSELGSETLGRALSALFADPGAAVHRLHAGAHARGAACEEVITHGGGLQLCVTRLDDDRYLWRLNDGTEPGVGPSADAAQDQPMLTAGSSGAVLHMDAAFHHLLGGRAKTLQCIFRDLPIVSGRVHRIAAAGGEIERTIVAVPGPGGQREIYVQPRAGGGATPGDTGAPPPAGDAIDALPVPLLKIAATGEILCANREAERLLGRPVAAPTRVTDLFEGLGRPIVDWLEETASGQGALKPEFLQARGRDAGQVFQVSLTPAGDAADDNLLAVLSDVTEFKSLEQQFVQSQKMQAVGQLAGGIAHDFNNLLTAITGHCDLLLLRHDQGDTDYADLVQISQNANRAAALVGQLLAYSRKQNLQPEVLNLRDTLSESTHLLNRLVGETITLTLDHDPDVAPVKADRRQLEQVLMNLVVNARDAMPEGGEISIRTENATLSDPLERDRARVPAGRHVCLSVTDTGRGIAPEIRDKMFEPFVTTKKTGEGTGLGLSTAYGIVKQTGGYIFADSEIGKGTRFTIYIPSYDGPHPENDAGAAAAPVLPLERAEGVVLLVEDEAPVRAFAARALKMRGYTVLEADSGEAALDLLADPEVSVDLFVTDVIMPGKDGPTWVGEALADRPGARVVFMSGYAEETFGEDQKRISGAVFLPKPFSLTELTRIVDDQMRAPAVS
ncbi:MAG: ATP-binding protein [Salibaculum sp.]|uniref:ATP-binding protein n=1 Tax=Salibaculum sp. TaxID=2855480 RepID=UPI0028701C2C|nr:ATP-binding protein [Salibaculum sp.]MDR9428559.1 ATP-binding protein [Salibaculum sp.]